jgi:hypothetical protein
MVSHLPAEKDFSLVLLYALAKALGLAAQESPTGKDKIAFCN